MSTLLFKLWYFLPFVLIFSCKDATKYDIRLNLKKGNVYFQNLRSTTTITEGMGEDQIEVTTQNGMVLVFEVLQEYPEYYVLKANINRVTLKTKNENFYINLDTDYHYQGDLFSRMVRDLTNKAFKLLLNKNGTVREIKGLESVYASIFDRHDDFSEEQKRLTLEIIKQHYGADVLKSNLEMSLFPFPQGPVSKSDQWGRDLTYNYVNPLRIYSEYSIQEVSDHHLTIKGKGTTREYLGSIRSVDSTINSGKDLEGSITSSIKINSHSGWVINSRVESKLEGTREVQPNPNNPTTIEVPFTFNKVSTITAR